MHWWQRGTQGPGRHGWLAGGTALAVGLVVLRNGLGGALVALHVPGEAASGSSALTGGRRSAEQALGTWDAASARFADFIRLGGRAIARLSFGADLVLVVVLTGLLAVAVGRTAARVDVALRAVLWGDERAGVLPAHRTILRWARWALPVWLAAGLGRDLACLVELGTDRPPAVLALSAHYAASAWLLLGALIVVPVVVAWLVLTFRGATPVRRRARGASAVRVHVAIVAVFLLVTSVGPTHEQALDAVRLWTASARLTLLALAAVGLFSAATFVFAARLLVVRRTQRPAPAPLLLVVIGAAVAAVGGILQATAGMGYGLVALGTVVAVVGALGVPLARAGDRRTDRQEVADASPDRTAENPPALPALLAAVPLVAFGATIVRAGVPELIAAGGAWWLVLIGGAVLAAMAVAYTVVRGGRDRALVAVAGLDARRFAVGVAVPFVVLAALAVAVWANVWPIASFLGVFGIVGCFLTLATLAVGTLGIGAEHVAPPVSLQVAGLRRTPVVLSLVAWSLVGGVLASGASFHRVRTQSGEAVRGPVTVAASFQSWLAANAAGPAGGAPASPANGRRPAVPLVLVAGAGGGIRAATFTALVTDCLFGGIDPSPCGAPAPAGAWDRLFALSGASGGSVGFASVVAERAEARHPPGWVEQRLGTDLLSPSIAWQTFVEVPNALLRLDPGMDRAEVLERTWERRFRTATASPGAAPFLGIGAGPAWTDPLLLLNATSLGDGCRFDVSRLDGAPPGLRGDGRPLGPEGDCQERRLTPVPGAPTDLTLTRDLVDYLCPGGDIHLSTAAFLSARFPVVSPTGRLAPCATTGAGVTIGDGGYLDNTGAGAALDLWAAIAPALEEHNRTAPVCVVPFFVEIDNGYQNLTPARPSGPGGPELLAPLTGILSVLGGRDAGWVEAAASAFARPLAAAGGVQLQQGSGAVNDPDRFARVQLAAHPGVEAPLGWSLSKGAVADIVDGQLTYPAIASAMATVRSWLQPGALTCGAA